MQLPNHFTKEEMVKLYALILVIEKKVIFMTVLHKTLHWTCVNDLILITADFFIVDIVIHWNHWKAVRLPK